MTTETHRMISKATLPRSRCGSGPAAVKGGSTGLVERQRTDPAIACVKVTKYSLAALHRPQENTSPLNPVEMYRGTSQLG